MIEAKLLESSSNPYKKRECYINSLPYAQEFFIEDMVKKSRHYTIALNSTIAGYFCVNSDKVLCEFYLDDSALLFAQEIFRFLLEKNYFVAADCKSFDHLLMSLCFDYQKKISCMGYMFRDFVNVDYSLGKYENLLFCYAKPEDTDKIYDMSGDFFEREELEDNINRKEVFILYSNDILLGAGICQKVLPGLNYNDIGMVVAENHRNKGIGTFIIAKLKEYCIDHDSIPICGCWYYNYASKRALEKAGFIAKHRLIRYEF
jgi:GNAT superfamily N-acetyltransferase